jgi:hypothetical protein
LLSLHLSCLIQTIPALTTPRRALTCLDLLFPAMLLTKDLIIDLINDLIKDLIIDLIND